MKKLVFVVLVSILLTSCNLQAKEKLVEPTDPMIIQFANQFAEWTVEEQIQETVVPELPDVETEMSTTKTGDWEVTYFEGVTEQIKGWVFPNLDPVKWPEFPNVDNPLADFKASDGLEYGIDEHQFCQQDQTCDMSVPAMHYRIISGDYDLGFDQCVGSVGDQGCAIMAVNVGDVTAVFRSIMIDLGFNVMGRYWNGDVLPTAIWAVLSHVGSNMLNMNSTLNPIKIQNAGANCSSPEACKTVRLAFVITSGNEVLVKGVTIISK